MRQPNTIPNVYETFEFDEKAERYTSRKIYVIALTLREAVKMLDKRRSEQPAKFWNKRHSVSRHWDKWAGPRTLGTIIVGKWETAAEGGLIDNL